MVFPDTCFSFDSETIGIPRISHLKIPDLHLSPTADLVDAALVGRRRTLLGNEQTPLDLGMPGKDAKSLSEYMHRVFRDLLECMHHVISPNPLKTRACVYLLAANDPAIHVFVFPDRLLVFETKG